MTLSLQTLPNGAQLLCETMTDANSVALGVFWRVGSQHDPQDRAGLAHALEHLCFKATATRDAETLNAQLETLSPDINAFTMPRLTAYHAHVLPKHQQETLALFLEMMRPALHPSEVQTEQGVILEEIAQNDDDPGSLVFDALRHAAFGTHPWARPVIGTTQSLQRIKPQDLRVFNHQHYTPERCVVVAAGAVDPKALYETLQDQSRTWHNTSIAIPAPTPLLFKPGTSTQHHAALQRAYIATLAPGPHGPHPHSEAAHLLSEIIGGSNSRFYWALEHEGLADSANHSLENDDAYGMYSSHVVCDPDQSDEIQNIHHAVLHNIQKNGVLPKELEQAKRRLRLAQAIHNETPAGRLQTLALEHMEGHHAQTRNGVLQRLDAVRLEDLHAVLEAFPVTNTHTLLMHP